jgi:hypothetical protein
MFVTKGNYPRVRDAFEAIECDSGGHLIGRVYPGKAIDFGRFHVPLEWEHLVPGAERGLHHLVAGSEALWETFVIGDQDEADEIEKQHGLAEARLLLDGYFNGWPEEDAPFNPDTSSALSSHQSATQGE